MTPRAAAQTAATPGGGLSTADYAAISAFRFRLRQFLAFSAAAARAAGLPPQQHQALLAIAGCDAPPSVGLLAGELQIAPHSAAQLVSRMVEAGLVTKRISLADRRRIDLILTDRAQGLLADLTRAHVEELRTLEPALVRALQKLQPRRAAGG